MKKRLYILTALCLPAFVSAQLQNLDFETRDNPVNPDAIFDNSPTGWICSNRWQGSQHEQFNSSFNWPIDTNAQHDDYAIRLFVWYNYMKDAAVQRAPINDRPTALKGFYKHKYNLVVYIW